MSGIDNVSFPLEARIVFNGEEDLVSAYILFENRITKEREVIETSVSLSDILKDDIAGILSLERANQILSSEKFHLA